MYESVWWRRDTESRLTETGVMVGFSLLDSTKSEEKFAVQPLLERRWLIQSDGNSPVTNHLTSEHVSVVVSRYEACQRLDDRFLRSKCVFVQHRD